MKLILFILSCIAPVFAQNTYQIKYGTKIYFDNGTVDNPYSRTIYGTNRTDLIICYEDADVTPRAGLCELALLDTANQKITFGSESSYDAPSSDVYETQLVDANGPTSNILVGYTSAPEGTKGPGKLVVGVYDLSTMSIKYGKPTTFNVGANDQSNVVELERNDSYFVVCYSVGANDQKGTGCRIGQYDLSALAVKYGTKYFTMPSNGPTDGMAVSRALNNATFVLCYANSGASVGECSIGTIPDLNSTGLESTISYSTPVVFNSAGGTDNIQIHHIYNNASQDGDPNLIVCYQTKGSGACSYLVVDMDNSQNPLQFKSQSLFAPNDVIDQPTFQVIYPDTTIGNTVPILMVCFVDVTKIENNETAGCTFGEVDVTKQIITFQDESKISNFEMDGADKIDSLYLGNNSMIVCYVDGDETNNRAPCIFGVISSM